MSKKHSEASKKRWDGIPAPMRSRIGRLTVRNRWKNTTVEERKEVGRMLVEARRNKKK